MSALPPKPVADRDTQPFWDAVAEHRLVVPWCKGCQRYIWQPKPLCPWCHTPEPEWGELEGEGIVLSWTVIHPPVLEAWKEQTPFVILLVEVDGTRRDVRLVGQLVDDGGALAHTDEGIDFGTAVALRWRVDEAGQTLPAWARA